MEPFRFHSVLIGGGFVLLILLLALSTSLTHIPDSDEALFHIPAVKQYIDQFPTFDLKSYHSASGPLPYMIWSVWGKLFGDSLSILRFVTLLFAVGVIIVVTKLASSREPLTQFMLVGLILIQPYFIVRSISIFTMVPALFFGLAALLAYKSYLKTHKMSALWITALMLCAAIASRQLYVSYAIGIFAAFVLGIDFERRPPPYDRKGKEFFVLSLPFLLLATLFVYWGGSSPPEFHYNATRGIEFRQLDFVLIFLGFWFAPIAFIGWRKRPKWLVPVVVLASSHLYMVEPYIAQRQVSMDEGSSAGIIAKASLILLDKGIPFEGVIAIQALLWIIGALVLIRLLRRFRNLFSLVALSHFVMLLGIPQIWERYYFPVIPILWLAFSDVVRKKPQFLLWIIFQIVITYLYFSMKIQAV